MKLGQRDGNVLDLEDIFLFFHSWDPEHLQDNQKSSCTNFKHLFSDDLDDWEPNQTPSDFPCIHSKSNWCCLSSPPFFLLSSQPFSSLSINPFLTKISSRCPTGDIYFESVSRPNFSRPSCRPRGHVATLQACFLSKLNTSSPRMAALHHRPASQPPTHPPWSGGDTFLILHIITSS